MPRLQTRHSAISEAVRVSGIKLDRPGVCADHYCIMLNPFYGRVHVFSSHDMPGRWHHDGVCLCQEVKG